MLLNIQKKRVEPDIMLIELEGRICLGNSAKELEWAVAELQKANERRVIVDLRARPRWTARESASSPCARAS